jgi:hypothetical protein
VRRITPDRAELSVPPVPSPASFGPATNRVSWASRAGWSGGKFSASKLYHSASASGPSATS